MGLSQVPNPPEFIFCWNVGYIQSTEPYFARQVWFSRLNVSYIPTIRRATPSVHLQLLVCSTVSTLQASEATKGNCCYALKMADPTIDELLAGQVLNFRKHFMGWISDSDDCFVSQSRGNKSVRHVSLYATTFHDRDDEFWDKFGYAIGNFEALERLYICNHDNHDTRDDEEVVAAPDWEILGRIMSHVRQNVRLTIAVLNAGWHVEEIRSLIRVIRGHPTITCFDSGNMVPYEASDALYSALATLPALESVYLYAPQEDGMTFPNPETLTELLRVPSLRSVFFKRFYFTSTLCHAIAKALMEGSAVDALEFRECSFSVGECAAILANGLARNTSVSYIKVERNLDEALNSVLATALLSNSTLRRLDIIHQNNNGGPDLSPIFLALGKNTGLKSIYCDLDSMDESLCTAMQNGLGMNETLESLEVHQVTLINVDLWCRAFSFLRTSKALKSLFFHLKRGANATDSCVSAFCSHIAAMLQENASLETLEIREQAIFVTVIAEYIGLITALQHNNTLKTLSVHNDKLLTLTHDEDKQMASLLKKNFALERMPIMIEGGDVGAILRLNEAGRRYLVQDGSSVSKGVDVLSNVNSDLNCVFLHLLENPRLCDRRAVEMVSAGGRVDESNN
jgi:hypothetical protein